MRVLLVSVLLAATNFGQTFGTWKMNAARSTFSGSTQPKTMTVRIEPHPNGEVFTLDRTEADGHTNSSSTLLYLDGEPREFQDFGCSGIQSSRRGEKAEVEILRLCTSGEWIRYKLRTSAKPKELVLEITEQHTDGRRFERRLILEKR
jgi:hypothetical protein